MIVGCHGDYVIFKMELYLLNTDNEKGIFKGVKTSFRHLKPD